MSRHGYTDDCDDDLAAGRWRGRVASAMRGKRGQAFLREMRDALDAMPVKRLVQEQLVATDGEVCAMGSVCARRGMDVSDLDPEDYERVAERLGLAEPMVQEIAYLNDELEWVYPEGRRGYTNEEGRWVFPEGRPETPEERWARMRAWVEQKILSTPTPVEVKP